MRTSGPGGAGQIVPALPAMTEQSGLARRHVVRIVRYRDRLLRESGGLRQVREMTMHRRTWGLIAGVIAVAGAAVLSCGPRQPPDVPMYASPIDLTLLAGSWSGEYTSRDGRRGRIVFQLEPGSRDATGEVYMLPGRIRPARTEGYGYDEQFIESLHDAEPIAVEFVWSEFGMVQGRLAPYRDPVLGTTLQAEFRGTWSGETIEGTFVSLDGGHVAREGWWRAVRTGNAAEGAPPTREDLPSYEELVARGREVFESSGCAACHEGRPGAADAAGAPALDAVVEHRTFPWIYNMVVHPDSMLRNDPTAKTLLGRYEGRMRDVDVTPWEALLLYEYLQERAAGGR